MPLSLFLNLVESRVLIRRHVLTELRSVQREAGIIEVGVDQPVAFFGGSFIGGKHLGLDFFPPFLALGLHGFLWIGYFTNERLGCLVNLLLLLVQDGQVLPHLAVFGVLRLRLELGQFGHSLGFVVIHHGGMHQRHRVTHVCLSHLRLEFGRLVAMHDAALLQERAILKLCFLGLLLLLFLLLFKILERLLRLVFLEAFALSLARSVAVLDTVSCFDVLRVCENGRVVVQFGHFDRLLLLLWRRRGSLGRGLRVGVLWC